MSATVDIPSRPIADRLTMPAVYAAVLAALFANGITQEIVVYIREHGLSAGVWNTFGLNAVLFVGLGCAIQCLRNAPAQPLTRVDGVILPAAIALLMVPLSEPSWVALTLVSLRLALARNLHPYLRAAGMIGAALAAAAFWCRFGLLLFASDLLTLDAMLVGNLLHLERMGNLLKVDDTFSISIQRGCSSFQGISLSILCWLSISRLAYPRVESRDLLPLALVVLSAFAVNIVRLAVMAQGREWFELAHGDVGASVASWTMLLCAAAIAIAWRRLDPSSEPA